MANEQRLIDANALHEEIKKASKDAGFYRAIYDGFLNCIDRSPTVDAVEVVRCKDCRYWADGVEGCTDHIKCCKIGLYMTGENAYCVYGKKVDAPIITEQTRSALIEIGRKSHGEE